jgi:hypothetical protein
MPVRKSCASDGDDIGSGLECEPVLQFCGEGHRGLVVDFAVREIEHLSGLNQVCNNP